MTDRKCALIRKESGAILTAILLTLNGLAAEAHRAYSSYGDIDEAVINKMLSGKKQKAARAGRARAKKPARTTPKTAPALSDTQAQPAATSSSPSTNGSRANSAPSTPANSARNTTGSATAGNTSSSTTTVGNTTSSTAGNTTSSTTGNTASQLMMDAATSNLHSKKSKMSSTLSAPEKMLSARPGINPPTSLNLETSKQHQ